MKKINNIFWKDAAASWSWPAKPDISTKIGSGGEISGELLRKPWEAIEDDECVDFDIIDYEATLLSMMDGGEVVLNKTAEPVPEVDERIVLDYEKFDESLDAGTLADFLNCFRLLRDCGLPEALTENFSNMANRMEVLEEAVHKFKKVYQPDLSMFMEMYIPEALNLTVSYIEYINAKVSEEIITSTQTELMEALDTLLIGVNEKIDEIYKFAAIEVKAAAKALNAGMNLDGYIDPRFKI